mmetsp:Transcript_15352/g.22991  ORF Transcript_15352/g.22991 Transcript_15352/m.22991 type:complete len:413 (+) Transcript_15352:24-1262(+)
MINSIFILNGSGDVIFEKHYRGLISRAICDIFWVQVMKASNPNDVKPVMQSSKFYLINIHYKDLWFLAVVERDVNPLLVVEFLYRVGDIFRDYFENVTESILKNNFVIVYQLLEELMDNGMPFNTEPNQLKAMITPPSFYGGVMASMTGKKGVSSSVPTGSMSNTPWRRVGVKYTANEVYFDIIEELDAIVDANGLLVSSEVNGSIQSTCHLSGMPQLTMIFRNPRILDDVSFHPCVLLSSWEQSKILSFVPPDGNYKLMSYRVRSNVQPPIYVKPQINFSQGVGRVTVTVGTKVAANKNVENVVVTIPWGKTTSSCNLTASFGKAQYDEQSKTLIWTIGRMPSDRTVSLSGSVHLVSGEKEVYPSIQASFKVLLMSSSGLKVESLAVKNVNYKPYKGVRAITKSGTFTIRT